MAPNTKRSPADVARAAAVFKALGHPERLRIVCELADGGDYTQTQLVDLLRRPQSSLARHLAPLRALGLVTGYRDGQEVPLALNGTFAHELLDAVCNWMHPRADRDEAVNALLGTEMTE